MRIAWSGTAIAEEHIQKVSLNMLSLPYGERAGYLRFLLHFRHLGRTAGPNRVIDRKATLTWRNLATTAGGES